MSFRIFTGQKPPKYYSHNTETFSAWDSFHSDGVQVYKHLGRLGYNHFYVIYEHHYVNPQKESLWGNFKMHLKSIRRLKHQMLDGHIDEFMYMYNHKSKGKIFDLLIQDIATYYPV